MSWDEAAELDPYRDEPPQMPSGVVGKNGYLRLGFQRRGERTALIDLDRRAPLFVHKALYWDECLPTMPCVFLITTTGAIMQGDRFRMEFALAPGTQAHLTTQSATQILAMDANYAAQTQELTLGEEAYLEYLPDPLCPHENARFYTRTHITLPESATLIYAETLTPGRKHHKAGEVFAYELFSSTLRAERPDGRELFTEKYILRPHADNLREALCMSDYDVFANVLVLTPEKHREEVLAQTPAVFSPELAAGASRLPNGAGLLYKVLGKETQPVQQAVRELWGRVRQSVAHAPLRPAFLWR